MLQINLTPVNFMQAW